jgi:hypothetical protein
MQGQLAGLIHAEMVNSASLFAVAKSPIKQSVSSPDAESFQDQIQRKSYTKAMQSLRRCVAR